MVAVRDLRVMPKQTFRQWFEQREKARAKKAASDGTEVVAGGRGKRCCGGFARRTVMRRTMQRLSRRSGMRCRADTSGGNAGREAKLELLEERLRDYDASVTRARTGAVAAEIARILKERGKRRTVVPQGLAEALGEALPEGFEFVADEGMTTAELDGFEGVVTASTVAIAETERLCYRTFRGREDALPRWCRTIICASFGPGTWWRRCRRRWPGWRLRLSSPRRLSRAIGHGGHRDDAHQGSAWAAVPGCDSGGVAAPPVGECNCAGSIFPSMQFRDSKG